MPPKPKGGKRGVSIEEKRARLLTFFTSQHAFYSIKEIETQGSKQTGIHAMQIKDVLQELIDDGLVNAEKCSVSTVYWCFEFDKVKKSKAAFQAKKDKVDTLKEKQEGLEVQLRDEKLKRSMEGAEELRKKVESLKSENKQLLGKLNSMGFSREKAILIKKQLQEEIAVGETYADNLESLIHHFKSNYGIEREFFSTEFAIPEELDDYPDVNTAFENILLQSC